MGLSRAGRTETMLPPQAQSTHRRSAVVPAAKSRAVAANYSLKRTAANRRGVD